MELNKAELTDIKITENVLGFHLNLMVENFGVKIFCAILKKMKFVNLGINYYFMLLFFLLSMESNTQRKKSQ